MHLNYTKNFRKNFQRRISQDEKLVRQFKERLSIFLTDPKNPVLKNHKLSGAKKHLRAFSLTGDIRVVYYQEEGEVYLVDIGTHNQVY